MPKMWFVTLVAKNTFSLVTAKLPIFLQHILWESCSETNFEQLSHNMFCKNIDSLAVAKETCCPWILAKRAIFLQNMLWESCSKLHFEKLSNCMFIQIIDTLAAIELCGLLWATVGKTNISQMTTHPDFIKHLFSYCFRMGHHLIPEKPRN